MQTISKLRRNLQACIESVELSPAQQNPNTCRGAALRLQSSAHGRPRPYFTAQTGKHALQCRKRQFDFAIVGSATSCTRHARGVLACADSGAAGGQVKSRCAAAGSLPFEMPRKSCTDKETCSGQVVDQAHAVLVDQRRCKSEG